MEEIRYVCEVLVRKQVLVNISMNFGFHKMWRISYPSEQQLASQNQVTDTAH